ncbi:MAG: hypothetical protein AAF756_02235 [Pseudomonadota bacterium]
MGNNLTVFVIGAGASVDVGLPTGDQLKDEIASIFENVGRGYASRDPLGPMELVLDRLVQLEKLNDKRPLVQAAKQIAATLPGALSIDNLMHSRSDDPLLVQWGKIGITWVILNRERGALHNAFGTQRDEDHHGLFVVPPPARGLAALKDSWLLKFGARITEGCTKEELAERFENLAFVVFNYDRCIEYFLYHFLKTFYHPLADKEIVSILKGATFLHPYGVVGELPWQSPASFIDLGDALEIGDLIWASKRIRTFTEGEEPRSDGISAPTLFEKASKIAFLGFSFLDLNMRLFKSDQPIVNAPLIFGTAMNMSDVDKQDVKFKVRGLFATQPDVHLLDGDCSEFFDHYSKWLRL